MTKTLYLYLIEDVDERVKAIERYFNCVNELLAGKVFNPNTDYPECHRVFRDAGFQKVQMVHLCPGAQAEGYYNYSFGKGEDGKWVTELKKYLRQKSNRIFLLDLALNKEERQEFDKDEGLFRATTATKVLKLIAGSGRDEIVIVESILSGLHRTYKNALDITENPEHVTFKFLSGNYFSPTQDPENKVVHINNAFKDLKAWFCQLKGV